MSLPVTVRLQPSVMMVSSTTGDWRRRCHCAPVIAEAVVAAGAVAVQVDVDHAVGVGVGVGVHDDAPDDAEDGSRRGDAAGEREDGGQGESGALDELAESVAEIL